MPLVAGFGFFMIGLGMPLLSMGVPHAGWVVISGLGVMFFGIWLWALEGPGGYMLKGYQLVVLPAQGSGMSINVSYLKRAPEGVLDDDAGEISSHIGLALTLTATPTDWQSTAPTAVDLISNLSPFSPVAESVAVVSLASNVLTLSGISTALVSNGFWVADVGYSPFPNLPTELHPLLEADVNCTLLNAAGDKRLKAAMEIKAELAKDLRQLMSPRGLGSPRPVINNSAPGMRVGRWGR